MVTAALNTQNTLRYVQRTRLPGAVGFLGLLLGTPLARLAKPLGLGLAIVTNVGYNSMGLVLPPACTSARRRRTSWRRSSTTTGGGRERPSRVRFRNYRRLGKELQILPFAGTLLEVLTAAAAAVRASTAGCCRPTDRVKHFAAGTKRFTRFVKCLYTWFSLIGDPLSPRRLLWHFLTMLWHSAPCWAPC